MEATVPTEPRAIPTGWSYGGDTTALGEKDFRRWVDEIVGEKCARASARRTRRLRVLGFWMIAQREVGT